MYPHYICDKMIADNIVTEFDRFSNNYTDDMIRCVPHYKKLVASLVKYLPNDLNPHDILDLGSGNGNTMSAYYEHFPRSKYTLVDISPEMHRICRERFPTADISSVKEFFKDLQFDKESFDVALASFSLHHIDAEEKKQLFHKIFEWLRPGGVFCYSDQMIDKTNPAYPEILKDWKSFVVGNYKSTEKWDWLMEHHAAFDIPNDYTKQINWLVEAGFHEVEIPWREECWTNIRALKKSG